MLPIFNYHCLSPEGRFWTFTEKQCWIRLQVRFSCFFKFDQSILIYFLIFLFHVSTPRFSFSTVSFILLVRTKWFLPSESNIKIGNYICNRQNRHIIYMYILTANIQIHKLAQICKFNKYTNFFCLCVLQNSLALHVAPITGKQSNYKTVLSSEQAWFKFSANPMV